MKRLILGICVSLFVLGATLGAEERYTTGRLTAAATVVTLDVAGMGTGAIQVTGTYVGTISFEVSVNGGDYVAVDMALPSTPGTDVNSTTTTGIYTGSVASVRFLRARMSAYTSGTAEIAMSAAGTGGGGGGSATIDLSGGSFSGNAAAAATGGAVPASADYLGISVAGTLTGVVAGQATMANSIPVTLASNQGAITVGDGAGALNVIIDSSATLTVTDGAGAMNTIVDSGTITTVSAVTAITNALPAGTNAIGKLAANSGVVIGDVNATLTAETTKAIGVVRLADGSGNLVLSNANGGAARALNVVVYDASGNAITAFSGSGGTASNFGSAVPSAGTASGFSDGTNMQLGRVVDADTGAGTVYTVLTNPVFRTSGTPVEAGTSANPYNVVFPSAQAVTCAACAATVVDDAAFTVATTPVTPVGGTYKVTRDGVNDGDAGAFAMTATRAMYISIETPLGDSAMDDTFNSVVVSPAGGAMSVTGSGNFQMLGAVSHDGIGTGVQPLLVGGYASAAAPTDVSADGDATRLWVLRNGSPVSNLAAGGTLITATSTSLNTNVTAGTVTTVSTVTSLSQLGGSALPIEDAAETGAGVGIYAMAVRRDTAASSSNATGDNSTLNVDALGKLWSTGTYAEDAAHSGGETITAIGCRRIDTAATSAGSSGDWATVDCDSEGKAWVNAFPTTPAATTYIPMRLTDGANFLTASQDQTHDAAISSNVGPLTMGFASAAAPTNVSADGDAVAAWFLRNGSQVSNMAAGSTLITATGTSLNVNVTGGGTAGTQFAEDSAHTTADIGTMVLGVRNTVPTDLSAGATAGDYEPFGVSPSGQIFTAPAGYVAADGAAAAVNPVLTGCYASQAAPSDVSADNDATKLWCLRNGSPVVNLAVGGTLITATSTSLNTNVTAGTLTTVSTVTSLAQLGGVALPIEDAAETAAGVGIYAMSVRRDTQASSAGTTGDNATLNTDATGNLWVTGTYLEDAAETAGGQLSMAGTVRRDAAATSAGTDGDNATLNTDALGRLWVNCGTGCSGGTQYTQDAALTVGTSVGGLAMGRASAAVPTDVSADNDAVMPWYLRSGAIASQPTYAGILAVAGNGASGTGVQRVTLANDSTGILALTTGTAQIGHLEANQSSNVAQINGVTPLMGNGASGTGALRVSLANDSTGILATVTTVGTVTTLSQLGGVALPIEDAAETAAGVGIYAMNVRRDVAAASAGTTGDNATLNTDAVGLLWGRHLDPCSGVAKTHIPINISTATTTEITPSLAGASTNYYICSINLVTAAANNVALVDDNTDGCGSVTAGLAGGLTAASGWNFAANGGLTLGNGDSAVFKTVTANSVVCLVTSASTQLSGSISVVAAP